MSFPARAAIVLQRDVGPFMSLRTERLSYVAEETFGRTLDVGCGPRNSFVRDWVTEGFGVDVFKYDGLTDDQIIADMTALPFEAETFDSVTLIAALNHIPRPQRDLELAEIQRVLRPGGVLVITMGNPVAEAMVHRLVHLYSSRFKTHEDMDHERGMEEDEEYAVSAHEIRERLKRAGFGSVRRRSIWTQWGLNALYVARK